MNHQDATPAKTLARDGEEINQCCSNIPVYEIVYTLGKKWFVCFNCYEIECFNSDIKEKVRIPK